MRTILDKRRRTIQEGQRRPEELTKHRNNERGPATRAANVKTEKPTISRSEGHEDTRRNTEVLDHHESLTTEKGEEQRAGRNTRGDEDGTSTEDGNQA